MFRERASVLFERGAWKGGGGVELCDKMDLCQTQTLT